MWTHQMRKGSNRLWAVHPGPPQSSAMPICNWVVATWGFAAILILAALAPVSASSRLPYPDLKAAITASYKARSDLLGESTGFADMVIEKQGLSPDADQRFKDKVSKDLGIDPQKLNYLGKGQWAVTWYKKGLKNRYDVYVAPPQQSKAERPFLVPTNNRVAVDPEKSLYYDVLSKEAYINRAPVAASNPYNLFLYFDIARLYRFDSREVPDFLRVHEESGLLPQITEDQIGQIRCVRIEYNLATDYPSGATLRKKSVLWVAPEMSYSLVKAQLFSNRRTKAEALALVEGYEAAYEESQERKGIWLLKNVKITDNRGGIGISTGQTSEILTASLKDTRIGIEIPDETFTFDGLGVPAGTKIYDRSLRAEPLEYYYKSFPVGQIDTLAGGILRQQAANAESATDGQLVGRQEAADGLLEPHVQDVMVASMPKPAGPWHRARLPLLVIAAIVLGVLLVVHRRRAVRTARNG